MSGRKKHETPKVEGWMSSLYGNEAVLIDRTPGATSKQSLRILNDDGARAFASALAADSTSAVGELTVMGPDPLRGGDPSKSMGVEGFRALGFVLGNRVGLTEIRFADHRVTYEAGIALADGLKSSRSLVTIAVWKCRVDDRTAYEMVVRLADIPSLKTINLGENVLTEVGKAQIEQWIAYSHNPALVVRMF